MINIVAEVRREHRHLRVAAVLLHDCFLDTYVSFICYAERIAKHDIPEVAELLVSHECWSSG